MGGAANSGFYIWALKDWADRSRSQSMIQQQIQGILDGTPGLQSYVFAPPSLPGAGGGLPISMVIQSIHAPERVVEIADQIRAQAMKSGMFIVVQNSLSFDAPQVRLTIDRDRAAQLGVAVSDVGATLGLLVGGGAIAQFDRDSNSYDVITQVPREWRDNPERLTEFFVRARSGAMVPLASVVSIEDTVSAAAIEQFNQLNSATLSAMPMIGISSGVALAELERITNEILPDGFFIDYSGQSRLEKSEGNTILLAFGFSAAVGMVFGFFPARAAARLDPIEALHHQ